MALESASFINQLNSANPAPTDLLAQGDDHIRLIKAVLKATFPNLTGAVTVTEADLNSVSASSAGSGVPTGSIVAWYGSSGSVPAGWHICDGSTVAKSDGSGNITCPDLRDRTVIGVGSYAATQGNVYGAANQTATSAASGAHAHSTTAGGGGHTHTGVSVGGHSLTVSEMPAHDHTIGGNPGSGGGSLMQTSGGSPTTIHTGSTGSGAAHTHPMSWPSTPDGTHTHSTDTAAAHTHGVTMDVHQPSLALHYIMKL